MKAKLAVYCRTQPSLDDAKVFQVELAIGESFTFGGTTTLLQEITPPEKICPECENDERKQTCPICDGSGKYDPPDHLTKVCDSLLAIENLLTRLIEVTEKTKEIKPTEPQVKESIQLLARFTREFYYKAPARFHDDLRIAQQNIFHAFNIEPSDLLV